MASNNRLRNTYEDALRRAGYDLTGRERMSTLRNKWKEFRSSYSRNQGTKAPSVYQYAREYQEQTAPTIDFGMDYINWFISKLEQIYRDTISFIDNNKEGTHESGKLASIADYRLYTGELQESYFRVLEEIRTYLDSGVPPEVLAQAIAENVELDYTIAIELIPPSDINFLFDETLEQLQGIWTQITTKLAEEEENKYYGV